MSACQCGRTGMHCPFCGCATLYGRASLEREVDGVVVRSYRCRKCARVFDDITRESCSAPHPAEAHSKRLANKVEQVLPLDWTPAQRLAWTKEQLLARQSVRKRAIAELDKEPSVADDIDSKEEP
jgi:hypothetical protein